MFLDAGYESKDDIVRKKGMNPIICEKGHRNNPLTDEQKQNNRIKSKDRCRIEHIFGFIEGAMDGSQWLVGIVCGHRTLWLAH